MVIVDSYHIISVNLWWIIRRLAFIVSVIRIFSAFCRLSLLIENGSNFWSWWRISWYHISLSLMPNWKRFWLSMWVPSIDTGGTTQWIYWWGIFILGCLRSSWQCSRDEKLYDEIFYINYTYLWFSILYDIFVDNVYPIKSCCLTWVSFGLKSILYS